MRFLVWALMLSFPAWADVSVEDVKCTRRTPWNGLVDIEYTIASDSADDDVYVNPVGFNGDTGLTVFMAHLSGDGTSGPVKPGSHTITWDSKADLNDYFATSNYGGTGRNNEVGFRLCCAGNSF